MNTGQILPLSKIPCGQKATVVSINAEFKLKRRLMELGIVPGTPIWVKLRAPLNSISLIHVRGVALALKNSLIQTISVYT